MQILDRLGVQKNGRLSLTCPMIARAGEARDVLDANFLLPPEGIFVLNGCCVLANKFFGPDNVVQRSDGPKSRLVSWGKLGWMVALTTRLGSDKGCPTALGEACR